MATITITVGALSSTHTFQKTDAEVAQVLRRFLRDTVQLPPEGWTAAQKNQYYLDEALKLIVKTVRDKAADASLADAIVSQAALREQAEADNAV